MTQRHLIVNADDFGASPGVNRGIVESHERGIVTSASLMVRFGAAVEAADYARGRERFSLGLHFDIGEWEHREGEWHARYERVDGDDEDAVARELDEQLDLFHRMVGRDPTHLDSHQHVHRSQPAHRVVRAAGRRLGVPVRHVAPHVRYAGDFFGQTAKGEPYHGAITVESLVALVRALPEGVTELGCHPGYADDLETTYRDERATEVATLCHPAVREALEAEGVGLLTFGDLPRPD